MPANTPESWRRVHLGEIAQINPESWDARNGGMIHYLDLTSVTAPGVLAAPVLIGADQAPSRARRKVRAGDIIASTVRPYLRGFARLDVVPDNLIASTGFAVIRAAAEADGAFVYQHILSPSFVSHLEPRMTGSNYPAVRPDDVGAYEFLLPPLPEQRAIAAVLDAVDDTIERTEAVIAATEELRSALLHELLAHGVPGWHSEWKHVPGLGTVPACWDEVRLSELADASLPGAMQSGPFGSSLLHSEFGAQGKLVIGIDNVLEGRFSLGRQHRVSQAKFNELRRYQARPGDVLITVMASLGRACVVPDDIEDAIVTKHVYRISVDQTRAEPSFIMWSLLASPLIVHQLYGSAQGQTRLGLNGEILKAVRLPLPPPDEQRLIVRAVAGVTDREPIEHAELRHLRDLKAALSSALLSGRVRVAI